jgi:flagella basal body P-ring formation protein FlgA
MIIALLTLLSPTIDTPPPQRAAHLVERNAIVTMEYRKGALTILAEGRALGAGGMDDRVRVMNMSSRTTIEARIIGAGRVAAP